MYVHSIELLPAMYAVNEAVKFFATISTDMCAVCSLAFGFKRKKHALDLVSMYILITTKLLHLYTLDSISRYLTMKTQCPGCDKVVLSTNCNNKNRHR